MKNDTQSLYTIHYTDQRGIARELSFDDASLLTPFIETIQLAEGHHLVGVEHHAA